MKTFLKEIYLFFARPFIENFNIFLFVSIMVCVPVLIGYYQAGIDILGVIWEAAHAYLLAYIAMVVISNIQNYRIRYIGMSIVVVLAIIDFIIESSCLRTTGSHFSSDTVAIVMATNIGESKEFIRTYFSVPFFALIIIGLMSLGYALYRFAIQINKFGKNIALVATFISIFSCSYFLLNGSESWKSKFYNKITTFITYELPPNLREYRQNLVVECSLKATPQFIVLILGESYSRSHSSLYGYEKLTCPRLSRMTDSLLSVYDNVDAPATNTIPCLKAIMSTYIPEYKDSVKWYECVTLPQIMSSVGYKTLWVSNQSPSGVFDNVAARYAELCDTSIWVGSKYKGVYKNDYDEKVLDVFQNANLFIPNDKYFIIIHLMGSHCSYSQRYPIEYKTFSTDDYQNYPEHQRQILSDYDNSVLYNDFIVSELFNIFSSKECLAYYFSDHSLDLFESSDDYFGYGKLNNPQSLKAAISIPYMVYGSACFQRNFPTQWNTIKENASLSYNTAETIKHISDMLGIQIVD